MKTGGILIGAAFSVIVAACGQGEATASEAGASGATAAAQAPLFTEATLDAMRRAPGQTIRESLDFAQEECGSAPLGFAPGGIRLADFNADGRPDYLVDMTAMMCGSESQGSGWCGSLGCSFDVFVSTGDDYRLDGYIGMDPEIVRRGDGLAISVMGRDGPWAVAWNGTEMENVTLPADGAAGNDATAPASGGDEAAVRAVVASIYDTYVAGIGSGATFPEGVETAGLRAVIDAAIDPEVGALGFDYYCACQDYDEVTYEITGVALNGDRATAAVDFRSYGRLTQMELRMLKVGGRWQVDDVIDPEGSLRALLGGG